MGILGALRWLFSDDDQNSDSEENRSRENKNKYGGKCEACKYGDKTRERWEVYCIMNDSRYSYEEGCRYFSSGTYEGKCKECRHNTTDEDGRVCNYSSYTRITSDRDTCSTGRYEYGNPS